MPETKFKIGDRVTRNPKWWPTKKWGGKTCNSGRVVGITVGPDNRDRLVTFYEVRMLNGQTVRYMGQELIPTQRKKAA